MDNSLDVLIRGKGWTPEKCKHTIVQSTQRVQMAAGVSWRHAEADPMVEVRRCLYCGKHLPMEQTLDTDAVQIEIQAAFLSIDGKENEAPLVNWTQEELLGYLEGANDLDRYLSWYCASTWAGWLAAKIDLHDDEQKEGQDGTEGT